VFSLFFPALHFFVFCFFLLSSFFLSSFLCLLFSFCCRLSSFLPGSYERGGGNYPPPFSCCMKPEEPPLRPLPPRACRATMSAFLIAGMRLKALPFLPNFFSVVPKFFVWPYFLFAILYDPLPVIFVTVLDRTIGPSLAKIVDSPRPCKGGPDTHTGRTEK